MAIKKFLTGVISDLSYILTYLTLKDTTGLKKAQRPEKTVKQIQWKYGFSLEACHEVCLYMFYKRPF